MAPDSGLALDENFDFRIDSTGDIDSVSDARELHKDLAGILWTAAQDIVGESARAPTQDTVVAEQNIRSLLVQDQRVIAVSSVDIRRGDGAQTLRVVAEIRSIYGPLTVDTADGGA